MKENLSYRFHFKIRDAFCYFKSFSKIANDFDTLIFEGEQGLMLHQNYKYFPHVTPSNTGIENVIELLYDEFNDEETRQAVDIEAIYITRSYLTRHGAGTMPDELKDKPYEKIEDLTNIPNRYQGTLRFGLLNLDLLKENIEADFNKSLNSKFKIRKSLAITCLDQIDDKALYIKDKRKVSSEVNVFI
ncbi:MULTISPECIES: adenylosuccinate synthetase [Clostridium]|nr:adenylosuccinate synthetase [Clostridium neonatale]